MTTFLRNLILFWMTSLTVGFAVLLWQHCKSPAPVVAIAPAPALPAVATFDSINVHRLNVIEPNGKPRVIISNRPSAPGIVWGGVEYPHPGRESGGILFFNDDGTEAGGMTYTSNKANKEAGAIITMDQYDQDQTLALMYQEQDGKRGAGFVVFDRPEQSMLPVIETLRDLAKATGDQKTKLEARMAELEKQTGEQTAMRVMVGKEQDVAKIVLADKQSRPRIVMQVDGKGVATLEFLDASGKVLRHLP